MISQLLPVLSALAGGLMAGLISYLANRSVKHQEWRLALAKEKINHQKKIFCDFLLCAQQMLMQSLDEKVSSAIQLNPMTECFSQIELTATPRVVEAAKQICDYVVLAHRVDPKDEKRNFFALKQEFILACRCEIQDIEEGK